MANGGRIDFTVGYKVDKTGLNEIKSSLNELKNLSPTQALELNPNLKTINEARSVTMKLALDIEKVEKAFDQAFDPTTGITNITKLGTAIQKLDLAKIQNNFSKLGPVGNKAFNQIAAKAMTTNLQFKETNNLLDRMGKTLGNTIKWSVSSSIINTFSGAIQKAYGYVQHLDTSLNDIRIVTGKSADEMDKFAIKANDAAKALGASTTEYTEAALIYYQQGLSDEESQARAETTLKAANVTGQTGREVSEQLTAVWNGYKVSAEETEKYVDKLAAVAATTASDLEELSTGMSKVASAANNMGVDIDQLNAQLATIISVTRQAPETAGTALKTIYGRMEDLKISGEDEEGVKLGEVSSTLDELGIHVMDAEGNLRDLGGVIEEVASKWDTWTKAQQNAAAQAMAGKRQYNNLLALFDNWDMYTSALNTSRNSIGTLQSQQNIYMESTAAHLEQLKTQWEDLYDSLLDKDDINSVVDIFTVLLDKVTNFVDAIGGGKGVLLGLGAVATSVFNKQISQGLEGIVTKFSNAKENAKALEAELIIVKQYGQELGLKSSAIDEIVSLKEYVQQYYDVMTQGEIQAKNELIEHAAQQAIVKQEVEDTAKAYQDYIKGLVDSQVANPNNRVFKTSEGQAEQAKNVSALTGENVNIATKAINEAISSAEKFIQAQNQVSEAVERYKAVLKDESSSQKEVEKASKDMQKAFEDLNKAQDNYVADANLSEKESDELANSFNNVVKSIEKYIDVYSDASKKTSRGGASHSVNSALEKQKQLIKESTTETIKFGEEQKRVGEESAEAYKKANDDLQKLKESIKATGEFDTRQFISGITGLISGISSLGFAFQSLTSLTKVWSDETTSTTDKVIQTMISLGMILPGIVSLYNGLSNAMAIYNVLTGQQVIVNGSLFAIESAKAAVQAIDEKTLEALNRELGTNITLEQLSSDSIDKETLSFVLNTSAVKNNVAAKQALGQAEGQVGTGTQGLIKNLPKLGEKLKGLGTGFLNAATHAGEFVQGATGIAASAPAVAVGIAAIATAVIAVTAAITAAVIAYKKWEQNLQETANKAEQAAKEAKEYTQELEEQKKVIDEVVDKYKELNKQYDETQVKQFRQEVYELCKQHNLQSLAVQALTADYEELDKIVTQAQRDINTQYNTQGIEEEKQAIQDSFQAGVWRDLKHSERDSVLQGQQTIDLTGFMNKGKADRDLDKKLQQLGIVNVDGDHITLESLTKVATENYDALMKVLNESATPAAKQLLEILNKQNENLSRYQELLEKQKTSYIDTTYGEKAQNISSAQEYDKLRSQMQNDAQLQSFFTDENNVVDQNAVNNFVQSWLNGIDTVAQYAQQSDYAEIFSTKLNLSKEEIESKLAEIGEDATQFIADNIDLVAVEGIDTFLEHYHDLINKENANQQYLSVELVLASADGKELKPEDIDDLFSQEGFETSLGKSKEEFEAESYSQQISDLTLYYIKANQLENDFQQNKLKNIEEFTQKEEETLTKEKEELERIRQASSREGVQDSDLNEKTLRTSQNKLLSAANESSFKMLETDEDKLKAAEEAIEAMIDPTKELTQAQQEYLQILAEKYDLDEKDIKLLYNKIKANEDYQKELEKSSLRKELKNLKDYNKALEIVGNGLNKTKNILKNVKKYEIDWSVIRKQSSGYSEDIDALQGAYSSLTSIIGEYNETQTLSMDNLQALLSMDTAYLSALQIENGQMSLNEEALKQIALAKLDQAEADAYAQAMEELHNAETEQGIKDAQTAKLTLADLGTAATTAADAARSGVADWKAYWDAALNREGVDNNAYTQQVGDALRNKLQAIDQVRQQIMNGNFSTTMNGPEKASSSGSESAKEAQHEDYLEREVDLYHDINLELKQIESTLGRIQKQNSYKWGKDLQEGLKRENKLLDKQLEKLQEKSRIQQKDIAQRRANLEAQGFQFSKDGSSTKNAEGVLDKLYAEYNSMVDTYNAMSADQQEEYKKQLEAKKKDIDKTENDLKNYESLFSEYQSILDELQELHYKQIENAVERFNNMVDVHLELDNAKKEWNDFWYEVVQDVDDTDFGGKIAQSMGKLQTLVGLGGKANKSQIAELTRHLEDTTTEVNAQIASRKHGGEDSLFEDATKLSKENLEKYRDQLMDAVREAKEEVDSIAENYIKILESAQDLIDEQIEGLESIGDHLEHNIELFKMVEGAQAYEPVIRQYQKLYQNDLNLLDTQRQTKEFWAEQIDRYEKLLAVTEEGSVEWKTYSDSMDKAVKNYRKAVQELDKTLQDTLKHAEELYKEQTEKAFKDLDKEISQGYGMDMVEEEWNLINELSSRYLDNVEKALEIEIYTNDLEKAAKATGLSVKNQEKLNKFKDEEIKKLKEKEKLTQYDIDESRARLAIMQAEMALEDQRANKSKMRLRRDNQGNYSYQYVADEQANEDGENGVLTAKKEWYELVKKRDKEVYDNRIDLSKKWMQYLEEANEAEKNKDYEKAAFLRGLAQEVQDELKQNNEEINKNTQDLISGTAQFFSDVENASVLPTSETVAATLVNDMEKVGTAGEKAVIKLGQIQDEYIDNTDKAIKQAGIEWEEYRDEGIDPTDESLKELVDTQEELDEKLNAVNEQLTTQEGNLRACEEAYLALKDAAVDAIESANSALEQLAKTAITTQQQVAASVAAAQAAARASSSASSVASNAGNGAGNGTATTSSNTGKYTVVRTGFGTKAVVSTDNRSNYIEAVPMNYSDLGPDKKKELKDKYGISSYNTGGYTGDWSNSDGKLAFLHQKELVLNEADTSNLLKAIYVLRQAVASFNFNQLADSLVYSTAKWRNQMAMQSMMSDRANMVNSITNDTNNDYKNITVNADFTGVRSADAIYQALVELENYGMQQSYSSAPHSNTSY